MAVSALFQLIKIRGSSKLTIGFLGQYRCIVFHAFSPICPTGINEIKILFVIHYPSSSG
jgi:hypothetical protein